MKKKFTTLLVVLILVTLSGYSQYISTDVNVNVISIDYKDNKQKLLDFIKTNDIKAKKQDEGKTNIYIDFVVNEIQYKMLEDLLPKLGFIVSKKINTANNSSKVNEIELELKYLNEKKKSYSELLSKMDDKSDNYYTFWKDLKSIEESIYNKEKEILTYNKSENGYKVSLMFSEESTTPEATKLSFVNMPGVEFSYLTIESPKNGLSSELYQGYFVKYLFTKGKSYFLAGAYKDAQKSNIDTARFNEMFLLGFGQDFYTRHLGKGQRKFFNLYSGYSVGGLIASGDSRKSNNLFLSPSIGVELFKNKYILLDTHVSYFIPISNNRNMRGISYNASFNFVF